MKGRTLAPAGQGLCLPPGCDRTSPQHRLSAGCSGHGLITCQGAAFVGSSGNSGSGPHRDRALFPAPRGIPPGPGPQTAGPSQTDSRQMALGAVRIGSLAGHRGAMAPTLGRGPGHVRQCGRSSGGCFLGSSLGAVRIKTTLTLTVHLAALMIARRCGRQRPYCKRHAKPPRPCLLNRSLVDGLPPYG